MRRVVEHLENFDSIRFERTVEDEETSKIELALHIISVNLVNLRKYQPSCSMRKLESDHRTLSA